MEYEAEYQARLKDEEEDQIAKKARLKAEEHTRAWIKVDEDKILSLEAIRKEEEYENLRLKYE